MKRVLQWFTLMLIALCAIGTARLAAAAPDIEVFISPGCNRCEQAQQFLDGLAHERSGLTLEIRDVRNDPAARERLTELAHRAGIATPGVPSFYVRDQLIVGFDGPAVTGAHLRAMLAGERPAPVPGGATCDTDAATALCGPERQPARAPQFSVPMPWTGGTLALDDLGLPLFTLALGLLDGFNPCSMWVLIFMLSLLAGLQDRRKLLLIAGTFVAVEGIAYYLFMAAWLNLFLLVGLSRASEVLLGILAGIAGAIHLKDAVMPGLGPSLAIPESAKPGIYARIRSILSAQQLPAALVATVLLAIVVQVVELMCTSGFPALYTRILTLSNLSPWQYYGYLLLYNAAYMFDDVVILAIGVVTLSQKRLQEREGRWLNALSGIVMLGLAVYLLLRTAG